MPACVLHHRAATGTEKKNPNQEFALERDFGLFIFMYMMDLGEELELQWMGGEK